MADVTCRMRSCETGESYKYVLEKWENLSDSAKLCATASVTLKVQYLLNSFVNNMHVNYNVTLLDALEWHNCSAMML